jgi:hypothetical protein
MDGNRTHPGRLSSAPQTVLKNSLTAAEWCHLQPAIAGLGVLTTERSVAAAGKRDFTIATIFVAAVRSCDGLYIG